MIDIRYLGAAPYGTEKDFDAALIRTQALTLASEAFARGAGRSGARRTHHNDTTAHGQWSYLVELVFSICFRRE